jgi:hypothetical protein
MMLHDRLTSEKVETIWDPLWFLRPGPVCNSYHLIRALTPYFLITLRSPRGSTFASRKSRELDPLLHPPPQWRDSPGDQRMMRHAVFGVIRHLIISPSTPNDRLFEAPPPHHSIQIIPSSSSPLNGIIFDLTRRNGGNVHTRGIVSITSSSVIGPYVPQNAADLESNSPFYSENVPNSWICYDFKNMRITPSHYSIRS